MRTTAQFLTLLVLATLAASCGISRRTPATVVTAAEFRGLLRQEASKASSVFKLGHYTTKYDHLLALAAKVSRSEKLTQYTFYEGAIRDVTEGDRGFTVVVDNGSRRIMHVAHFEIVH